MLELDLTLKCTIIGEYPLRALHCAEAGVVSTMEEIEAPCEPFTNYLFTDSIAGSRFKWYELDGERITVAENDSSGQEFVRYDVLPDEAEMYNKTYYSPHNFSYHYQSRPSQPPYGKTYSARDGVCAIGRVRHQSNVREGGYVSAGTAPKASNCPVAPSW